MIKVYIASAYTKGDVAINVKTQLDCGHELMNLGFAPFVPLLTHFQHMVNPRPYEDWLKFDKEWVLACDCVLRLPGESSGADGEVKLALANGKKVFYSIEELKHFYSKDIDKHVMPRLFAITGNEGWNEFFWDEEKAQEKINTQYKKDFPLETFWTEEIRVS